MSSYRLRSDLARAVIDGFALPLGIGPDGIKPPMQGYTLTYTSGEDDEPDTYAFHVVVSHERLKPIIDRVFTLLPPEVYAIVEIGSRDAYRNVDVYLGVEPISLEAFRRVWENFEPLLLEDATIAVGANSEDPFIEVFLDQWKSLAIHVPLAMREEVETLLHEFDLEEVPQTWDDDEEEPLAELSVRPVLAVEHDVDLDIDDLLMELRQEWALELNIDPDTNVDERGRKLGMTLWHALVIVEEDPDHKSNPDAMPRTTSASIWATAGSLAEMEEMISAALDAYPEWQFVDMFTVDRVAYDSRPDELASLPPRRTKPEIHLVQFDA
jgi:hypothetical protein